jgi:oxygen-independent coproporphyrinogen-3 oxidase
LNIDLIYGIPGQTVDSWLGSIREALRFNPEELYLYPLYVRPLTGLGRKDSPPAEDRRLELYREGRAFLEQSGYTQESMRMFRRAGMRAPAAPHYCCQDDGMVGLGCGARSYTTSLHYSSRYAVTQRGVREILSDYVNLRDAEFDVADYGITLGPAEQRRRWVIKTLLRSEGLSPGAYSVRFGGCVFQDMPQLEDLEQRQLARKTEDHLTLTPRGLELSDAIGVWLYSAAVVERMETFELQ